MDKSRMVTMRMPVAIYEALQAAAAQDMRPVSQLAIKYIADGLRAGGHLADGAGGPKPAKRPSKGK